MKFEIKNQMKYQKGAAMIIVVFFFMFISLTIMIGIVTPVVREFRIASDNYDSKTAFFLAESGIEDIMFRIKNNMEVGTIGVDRTLYIDETYKDIPTEITDLAGSQKKITTMGDIDQHQRKVDLVVTTSTGVSFNYGVLVGSGGITLEGSGTINGNVYANGPIIGDSSAVITGSAISANSPSMASNQQNGQGIPPSNINFGNNNATQDIAQSFKVTEESPLNKIQLYIKKTGSPSNALVKIFNDSNGNIGGTLIANGTLSASSVTSAYGWVDVSLNSNSLLDPAKTYWLVVDAATSNSKYYTIGATTNNSYTNGNTKIGQLGGTWNNSSSNINDYYFSIFLGGMNGLIAGSSGSQWNQLHVGTVSGTAQANTVNYTNSTGNIYCKTGTGNNKSCIDQPDPTYIAFPVSDANISEWKSDALSGGVINGNYTVGWAGGTLGPKKIVGNLNVGSGGDLVLTGTVWVTGNIILNGGATITLDPSYGTNDGVLLADGNVSVSGGAHANGSGQPGSYLMLLSLSESTTAMVINGGAGAVIAYATNGTLEVSGGAALKEATGYKMLIKGNSNITYESGLTNNNFSSGPSGSWSIDSWKETE